MALNDFELNTLRDLEQGSRESRLAVPTLCQIIRSLNRDIRTLELAMKGHYHQTYAEGIRIVQDQVQDHLAEHRRKEG